MSAYRKKLIEVALPLEAINAGAGAEKAVPRHGHPQTLHLWWARRPLAAARAILFGQLVDDPSSWPDVFPTEDAQNGERQRLFRIIEDLVQWENSNNAGVINAARLEIARSHARGSSSVEAKAVLGSDVKPEIVDRYLATEVPPIHDPFAGGGTIPLEAQRLGLRAIASDLNPVAVMINKALIEIAPRFSGLRPVNPAAQPNGAILEWEASRGLADDVRYYGTWMREEARKRIGHLYPRVMLPKEQGGREGTVVAWLWARTVESPDPAFRGCHVPLISNFWLSTKPGRKTWLRPVVNKSKRTWRFEIGSGEPENPDSVASGTKSGRGDFTCLLSGAPIPATYLREAGKAKTLRDRLLAVVVEAKKGRVYIAGDNAMENVARVPIPDSAPTTDLPNEALGFRIQNYGLTRHQDLFTPRQLVALTTFAALIHEARTRVLEDTKRASRDRPAEAYADAVAVYLAFCLSKLADWSSSICGFIPGYEKYRDTFARPTISMTWDFAELNPFSDAVGNWGNHVEWVADVLDALPRNVTPGSAYLMDAASFVASNAVISTDPPYYDNIGYGDLSDFFYVWLRAALRDSFGDVCSTVLVPKANELIASSYRHGGRQAADKFFMDGMRRVLQALVLCADATPLTLYYAFRQSEDTADGASSTGWESFLSAVLEVGYCVLATWPVRSERTGRMRDVKSNALASSIVLVCRKRPDDAPATTRGDFRRMLRRELPDALKKLQQGNIAPVDVAQASIGPGMGTFSRHSQVLEADGSAMSVRSALQLINEVLDEYLASGEGDFDADTRFAITWYEQHGWEPGAFGDAETLAKARNVSVSGVVDAGICKSAAGKVRILKRSEMRPLDYDPATDERPTVWEFTQHMIRYLEEVGEEAAARLLKKLGSAADATRELAYRLYNTCERKKWAEDARSYNGLILAWPELEKLVSKVGDEPMPAASSKSSKKGAAKQKSTKKGQQELFGGNDK